MEVILLERISRLGAIGDVVNVRNGFARNYLIPQSKALRANKANREVFEAQRDQLEKTNIERRDAAQIEAKKLEGVVVTVVRQASDDGKLYGSVSVRDVSDALEADGHTVDRRLIDLNATIKSLGLYNVTVSLHPEVPVTIQVHVARNADSPLPSEMLEEPKQVQVHAAPAAKADADADADADDAETSADEDNAA